MKTLSDKMMKIVERRRRNLNTLCTELIQAKSENPPGDVTEAATVIERFLEHENIKCQAFEPEKGHRSIVATAGEGKSSLILCGHIDVVPAGEVDKWSVDPYRGQVKQGKLYGRGSTDMKGGVAATLTALAAAKEYESELARKITVAIVPDEEAQGPGGTLWLLENKKLTGDMCVITEPTGYLDCGYGVVGGERGTCWLRITAHGKPAHGSTPALGKNAIEMLTRFLPKLRALQTEEVKTPKDAEVLIRNGEKELRRVAGKHRVSPNNLAKTLTHYTINLGVIGGGTKTNVAPEKCEAEIDIRVPVGGRPEGVEEFVRSLLPPQMEFNVINKTMPSYTPATHPLVKAVQESAQQILSYRPPATYMAATTDAHYFRELLHIPAVAFGPGYIDIAHMYDEFVYQKDIIDAAKIYANTIANLAMPSTG